MGLFSAKERKFWFFCWAPFDKRRNPSLIFRTLVLFSAWDSKNFPILQIFSPLTEGKMGLRAYIFLFVPLRIDITGFHALSSCRWDSFSQTLRRSSIGLLDPVSIKKSLSLNHEAVWVRETLFCENVSTQRTSFILVYPTMFILSDSTGPVVACLSVTN